MKINGRGKFIVSVCLKLLPGPIQCQLITVKPVLRGHLWDKKKWSFKTGNLLKEDQFI